MKPLNDGVLFFLAILVIAALFELSILCITFFGADKVECNLLWCTFTTERGASEIIESRSCYVNGEQIPCGNFGAEGFSREAPNGVLAWNNDRWDNVTYYNASGD